MPEPHCWLSQTLVNWAMESVFLNEYHYFFPASPHQCIVLGSRILSHAARAKGGKEGHAHR